MRDINMVVGAGLCLLWLLVALLSVVYMPYDPLAMALDGRLRPPSVDHWMGTDQYGRDLLSRILAASGVSLMVSALTVLAAFTAGVLIGAIAGYLGGSFDRLVMVVAESFMAFPSLLLVLLFLSISGPSIAAVILALSIAFTPMVIRVTRSSVFSLREQQFIEAARLSGSSKSAVLWRHLLPNCVSPLSILATSMFANVLLVESALSFLGLGVPAPQATWGALLADSRQYLAVAPWLSLYPGVVITLAVVGVNLLGDGLRDLVDPRLRQLVEGQNA
ncbi:MAG: ABC transporter permease [Pseudomonadota bacterium]